MSDRREFRKAYRPQADHKKEIGSYVPRSEGADHDNPPPGYTPKPEEQDQKSVDDD